MIRAHLLRWCPRPHGSTYRKYASPCCLRAPPRSWTLLIALAGFLRQAARERRAGLRPASPARRNDPRGCGVAGPARRDVPRPARDARAEVQLPRQPDPRTRLEAGPDRRREIKAGKDQGPLHGIPYGAKDLLATEGIRPPGAAPYKDESSTATRPSSASSKGRRGAGGQAEHGRGGRRDGLRQPTPPSPARLNPWNPDRWSGGSSGRPRRWRRAWCRSPSAPRRGDRLDAGELLRRDRPASDLWPRRRRGDGPELDARQDRPHVPDRARLRPRPRRHRRRRRGRFHHDGAAVSLCGAGTPRPGASASACSRT